MDYSDNTDVKPQGMTYMVEGIGNPEDVGETKLESLVEDQAETQVICFPYRISTPKLI